MFRKKTPSKPANQNDSQPHDSVSPPGISQKTEIEGFVCPVCMVPFANVDALQHHFDSAHADEFDNSESSKGSSGNKNANSPSKSLANGEVDVKTVDDKPSYNVTKSNLNHSDNKEKSNERENLLAVYQELNDLRENLKEELWYSKELKKECAKLEEELAIRSNSSKMQEEYSLMSQQLNISIESQAMMKSKIRQFQEETANLESEKAALLKEVQDLKHNLKEKTQEKDEVKEKLDLQLLTVADDQAKQLQDSEAKTTKLITDLQDRDEEIINLKSQISDLETQRCLELKQSHADIKSVSTSGDCESSSPELIEMKEKYESILGQFQTAQSSLEQSTQHNEKLTSQLNEQQSLYNDTIQKLTRAGAKEEELLKHIKELEEQAQSNVERYQELEQDVNKAIIRAEQFQKESNDLQQKLRDTEETVTNLRELNEQLQDKNSLQNKEIIELNLIKEKLSEVDQALRDNENKLNERNFEISSLTNKILDLQSQMEQLTKEKRELMEKMDSGDDATKTVINQLEEEKKHLHENLNHLNSSYLEKEGIQRSKLYTLQNDLENSQNLSKKYQNELAQCKEALTRSEEKATQSKEKWLSLQVSLNNQAQRDAEKDKLIEELRSTINNKSSAIQAVEKKLKKLEESLTEKETELTKSSAALKSFKDETETVNKKMQNMLEEMQEKKSKVLSLEGEVASVSAQMNKSQQFCEDLKTELKMEKEMYAEKVRMEELLTEKLHKLHESKSELNDQYLASKEEITNLQQQLELKAADVIDKESLILKEQEKFQALEKSISQKDQQIRSYEKKLVSTEESAKTQQAQLKDELEKEVENRKNIEILLDDNRNTVSELIGSLATSQEEVKCLTDRLNHIQQENDTIKEELTNEKENSNRSTIRVEELQKIREELQADLMSMSNNLESQSTQYEQQKSDWQQKVSSTEKKCEELEVVANQLRQTDEDKTEQIKQLENEMDTMRHESNQMQDILREENAELQASLDSETKIAKQLSADLAEERSEKQLQVTQLETSLLNTKRDLERTLTQFEELQIQYDATESEKLELQVKLEASEDERHNLMERIISSEDAAQQLEESLLSKKEELGHLQAAILDLGRENQSLQINREKLTGRFWMKDDECLTCAGCQKIFTVTIRKHHCRNCGIIFCNECSAKSAPTAASKKAVRVCDTCYMEIMQNRRDSVSLSSTQSLNN